MVNRPNWTPKANPADCCCCPPAAWRIGFVTRGGGCFLSSFGIPVLGTGLRRGQAVGRLYAGAGCKIVIGFPKLRFRRGEDRFVFLFNFFFYRVKIPEI